MKSLTVIACALFVVAGLGYSDDYHVPDDFPTIQAALVGVMAGDTVIVGQGTYVENINFLGKAVTLRSEMGADVTIIDGNWLGSVVTFMNGEDEYSVLEGFTLTNGSGTYIASHGNYNGGGVICYGASPTLRKNIIKNNVIHGWAGAGVYLRDSNSLVEDNDIHSNENTYKHGGGVYTSGTTTATLIGNRIHDNIAALEGGGLIIGGGTVPTLKNNLIYSNFASRDGGGIYIGSDGYALMENNTITMNKTNGGGGGVFIWSFNPGMKNTIKNSIIWGNEASTGKEIYLREDADLTISFSDVKGGEPGVYVGSGCSLNWGDGMIDEDPLFIEGFYIEQDPCQPGVNNPCVDTGDAGSPMIEGTTRTDGVQDQGIIDMGYHYPVAGGYPTEVDVNYFMALDKTCYGNLYDMIMSKGNIELDSSAPQFDPENDDVVIVINDEEIEIPAGSFEEKSWWYFHWYAFKGNVQDVGFVVMNMNFECGTWCLKIFGMDATDLVEGDGATVELIIGENTGTDSFVWSKKWSNCWMDIALFVE